MFNTGTGIIDSNTVDYSEISKTFQYKIAERAFHLQMTICDHSVILAMKLQVLYISIVKDGRGEA